MDVFNLVAKLSLDSSEYDRALWAAKGTTTKAGGSMVDAVNGAKKKIGIAALGMGAAIGAFGMASVKTGMKFDSAMSQVAATQGKTMDEMLESTGEVDLAWGKFSGNLREYAQEMGKHTKFSATESAEALNYMALAGYDTQKSMQMLPPVLNLAAAGNMDLANASDMVTDASSALGLSQEQTVQMVDQMAKAASKSNTSVEQLGSAMLTVGGTAKVLRGGTTELSTALGILADNGTKGAEGGTALRNVLSTIQGAKFEKTFGALGVEAYDANGKLRSLKDIFLDMEDAMDGMTDEQRTEIINKTFNARDLKNVNALLGTSAKRWDELSSAIDDSKGAAEQMAGTQMDNLEGDITLLKSAFEGLQISVSDKLMPVFRGLVQGLTWAIEHASTLGPIILGLATAFGTFAVAINIGTIVNKVRKAFVAFNAVLAANPIGLVISIIAGLVVALVALYKNNEDFRNKVNAIWASIKTTITAVVEGIKSFLSTAWEVIKSTASTAWEVVKTVIINPVKAVYNTLKTIFELIRAVAIIVFVAIANATIKHWNNIKNSIITPIKNVYTNATKWFNSLKRKLADTWSAIKAKVGPAWSSVKSKITAPINTAVSSVTSKVNALKSKLSTAWNSVKTKATSAWNSVKNAITRPIKNAYNTVKGWVKKLKNLFPLKVGKILTGLKVPKIKVSGGKAPFGIGGKGEAPSISVAWNKKAEDNPYLFTKATLFGAGEHKNEILYGKQALMDDIKDAVGGGTGTNVVMNITNYFDGTESPEAYADRFVRGVQMKLRTI